MSPLNVRLDQSWTEKVKIYFLINRMRAVSLFFAVDSNLHVSLLVKHFNHYDDGHLIRREHDSYSSENNRVTFGQTDKRERVTKAPKPQAAIPCSAPGIFLASFLSCKDYFKYKSYIFYRSSLPFFKLSVLTLTAEIPSEFYSLTFYLQMLDSTS